MRKELEQEIYVNGLDNLTEEDLAEYYLATCERWGLDPTSRPFEYIVLNKKKVLYTKKNATDLLAATRKLTRKIVEGPIEVMIGGTKMLQAKCRVTAPDGREDEDVGITSVSKNTENAWMICVTKAKRRATLSFLGLGMLDESELESIPASAMQPVAAPVVNLAAPATESVPETKPKPGALRGRIALANAKALADMVSEVQSGAEEEKQAYVNRWVDLFKGFNDVQYGIAKGRLDEIIPNDFKKDAAWDAMGDYIEAREHEIAQGAQ